MYGDGMKKAILLMSAVVKAKNGILLLDEFETAIHTSAMNKTFHWILRTCRKLNVQVFLTSHSKEAIDKVLKCAPEIQDDIALSMLEQILMDIYKADETWNIILLRYFNPIGAHKSGLMGENPNGIPNNLMPYVTQVAVGKLKELGVFGNDYDTPDGTGVRDYIHVVDLAKGHVKALQKIDEKCGLKVYNLGTGKGYSVLDIVKNFEAATGMKVPYVIKDRRPGDIATCYCDPGKAAKELGWKAENGIKEMCEDSWRWQKNNPNGYEG